MQLATPATPFERMLAQMLREKGEAARTVYAIVELDVSLALREVRRDAAALRRREVEVALFLAALAVEDEQANAVEQEQQLAQAAWGRTCPDCGDAIPFEYAGRRDAFYCYCDELAEAEVYADE